MSGGRGYGYRTVKNSRGSRRGSRNPGPVRGYADTTSTRRSMNIEDILNPCDEDTKRSPGSLQGNRAPRFGQHSHAADTSARSLECSRPPPPHRGSGSPDVPSRTRAFRPAYSDEEQHFIWYLRIDCGYSWTAIADFYNARFSQDGEGRREIPGLQCRFYRTTEANGLPNVREMRRTRHTVQRCAMREITGYTREKYSWLDGRHPASTAYGHML